VGPCWAEAWPQWTRGGGNTISLLKAKRDDKALNNTIATTPPLNETFPNKDIAGPNIWQPSLILGGGQENVLFGVTHLSNACTTSKQAVQTFASPRTMGVRKKKLPAIICLENL